MEPISAVTILAPRVAHRVKVRQSYAEIHKRLEALKGSGKWLPLRGSRPGAAQKIAHTLQQLYRRGKSPDFRLERSQDATDPLVVLLRLVPRTPPEARSKKEAKAS